MAQKFVKPAPLRRLLSGTDLGHPSHPMLVQLPIGLWTSTWVLDLIGLGKTKAARTLVGLGVLTALPAVASGMSDWVDTDEAEARVGLVHATTNSIAVVCFSVSWWRRKGAGTAVSFGRCSVPPSLPRVAFLGGIWPIRWASEWTPMPSKADPTSGLPCEERANRGPRCPHSGGRPGDGGPERRRDDSPWPTAAATGVAPSPRGCSTQAV